ncbi:MAG: hypothetical protein ABC537_01750 [Candidatus Methanosuratincola sp.]
MDKGQISLIDALGALLAAVLVLSAASLAQAGFEADLCEIAEKEMLRQEIYHLIASGNMTHLLDLCAKQGSLDLGDIKLSLDEPENGPYVPLFFSRDGGIILFYVTRKG